MSTISQEYARRKAVNIKEISTIMKRLSVTGHEENTYFMKCPHTSKFQTYEKRQRFLLVFRRQLSSNVGANVAKVIKSLPQIGS